MTVRAWEGRARAQALAYVKRLGRTRSSPCVICEQAIDYGLEYPHLQSCSVQHLKSRRDYPELTWSRSNWAPAHLDCNKRAGAEQSVGLGLSTSW